MEGGILAGDMLEERVKAFIVENQMIQAGDGIVLGLSGGADSVCLFFVLLALREELAFRFVCAHVHHGLRGKDADADEVFARELCGRYGVEYYSFFYQVKEEAGKYGCSEEEMGRILRYKSFGQVLNNLGFNKIAVAHHMGDQAETVLYHLCRGSGLAGLAGIRPVSRNRIRPILCLKKEEIIKYLQGKKESWREDKTNQELLYVRNRIRNRVFSCLEELVNPASVEHIATCAGVVLEAERYIEKQAKVAWGACARCVEEGVYISLEYFAGLDVVIQKQMVFFAVDALGRGRKDIQAVHLDMVLGLIEAQSGKEVMLPGILVVRDYSEIFFGVDGKNRGRLEEIVIDGAGEYGLSDGQGILVVSGPMPVELAEKKEIVKNVENIYTKWFDYDKIKDTLQLRTRKEGDFLEFSKEGSKKKLKSYFIDSKVPRRFRDRVWLLAEGSHILWVVGYRISEKYKVTESTKWVVRVQMKWR